jgi:hypothetical protein
MAPTEDDLPEKQLPSIPKKQLPTTQEEQTSPSIWRDRLKNVARSAVRGNRIYKAFEAGRAAKDIIETRSKEIANTEESGKTPPSLIETLERKAVEWLKDEMSDSFSSIAESLDKHQERFGHIPNINDPDKYGKGVLQYIKSEKQQPEEPYFQAVRQDELKLSKFENRLKEINQEEQQLERNTRSYSINTNSWDSKTSHNLFQERSKLEVQVQALQQKQKERQATDSLAKIHTNFIGNKKFEEQTKQAIAEAQKASDFFERNRFQGSADEKHQYLWTKSVKSLGEDYFDPVQHPDRTTRLARFIGERLYQDGYDIDEIRASYAKNPHTPNIKPDDPWLVQQTQFDKSPELKSVRTQINLWRSEHHPEALKLEQGTQNLIASDKRSPLEVRMAQAQHQIAIAKTEDKRFEEAEQVYEKFTNDFLQGKDGKLTTKEEYQIELYRQVAKSEKGVATNELEKMDVDIAAKLRLAGHKQDDIIQAIKESSLSDFSRDVKYGENIYLYTQQELQTPKWQEQKKELEELRSRHPHLKTETRLNRLKLHSPEDLSPAPKPEHEIGRSQTQDYLSPSKPFERDIEIER